MLILLRLPQDSCQWLSSNNDIQWKVVLKEFSSRNIPNKETHNFEGVVDFKLELVCEWQDTTISCDRLAKQQKYLVCFRALLLVWNGIKEKPCVTVKHISYRHTTDMNPLISHTVPWPCSSQKCYFQVKQRQVKGHCLAYFVICRCWSTCPPTGFYRPTYSYSHINDSVKNMLIWLDHIYRLTSRDRMLCNLKTENICWN